MTLSPFFLSPITHNHVHHIANRPPNYLSLSLSPVLVNKNKIGEKIQTTAFFAFLCVVCDVLWSFALSYLSSSSRSGNVILYSIVLLTLTLAPLALLLLSETALASTLENYHYITAMTA